MDEQTYLITFDNVSAAEANRYAEELRQALLDASPDVAVHRRRDDPQTQDFGATLMLLLGTPVAGAIVTAIGNWLALRNRASLTIKRADGEIVVQNVTNAKAAELAQLLLSKKEPLGMEVQAPSSQTTLLILLGASAWPLSPEFQSSEAFVKAARRVKAYFLNPRPFGLPAENLCDLFDSKNSADEQDEEIAQFLKQRLAAMKDTGNAGRDLLLYFIGHGGFAGDDHEYYLAIRRTRTENPLASGLRVVSLAYTLKEQARHLRRIIILDCCFAAAAFSAFQGGPDEVALVKTTDAFRGGPKSEGSPTKGTTLLCSSGQKSPSLLLSDGSSTMFTKAILDTLVQGTPSRRDHLSLRDVKDIAADFLYGIRNAPRPVVLSPDQSEGDVADIPFFPNPWFEEERLRKAEEERRRLAEEAERTRRTEEERQRRVEEDQARQAERERERKAREEQALLASEEKHHQAFESDSQLQHPTNAISQLPLSDQSPTTAALDVDRPVQMMPGTYHGHSSAVYAVAWSPDGKQLASAGDDRTVQIWNPATGKRIVTHRGYSSRIYALTWSPDSSHIAFSPGNIVQVWDTARDKLIVTYRGYSDYIYALTWSPDGSRIAFSPGNIVQVWQAT